MRVAEFVNDSLQAGATCVAIDLLARDEKSFPIELLVVDDGIGMERPHLPPPSRSAGQVASMTGPRSGDE
jgi:hypothetical protein